MPKTSAREKANRFLALSKEFRLGDLITEKSHPETRNLSEVARVSVTDALDRLFTVDKDVVKAYQVWCKSESPAHIAHTVLGAFLNGRRVFFTGCGATGRLGVLLETVWRRLWKNSPPLESLVCSVIAGGDYALIKSVEGFEDFTQFGAKQLRDVGVSAGDVVFAITEGGETPFVIGTAWEGLRAGAKVYFVYCNPDDVLRRTVTRSKEVLKDPRIEKVNLTTGPMAIMGSTRMQAASVQLCAMLTVLEIAARYLKNSACEIDQTLGFQPLSPRQEEVEFISSVVCEEFLEALEAVCQSLRSENFRKELAGLVYLEETVYRLGRKSTYFADYFAVDVLTDTTERSPTFCIPPFRKWDDLEASESWTHLILPREDSCEGWEHMLCRPPRALTWTYEEIRELVGDNAALSQLEVIRQIGTEELLKFRIGIDGLQSRPVNSGDVIVCVIDGTETDLLVSPSGFFNQQVRRASSIGALTAIICLVEEGTIENMRELLLKELCLSAWAFLPLPKERFLLGCMRHIAVKMLLNALSTCTMTRLGRIRGNCMTAVVPSNFKLIDRATRYIQTLTGLSYEEACYALFEAVEYVYPRMRAGKQYPPVVELAVTSITNRCSLGDAEISLKKQFPVLNS
jgi:N-acetylmuramic acid 6-phosphate etherase